MKIDFYTKAVLTVIAVCLVALLAGRVPALHAQATRPFPTIVTGNDFGIRIDGWNVGKPITGTLLVQVNGQWHEVQSNPSVTPEIAGALPK